MTPKPLVWRYAHTVHNYDHGNIVTPELVAEERFLYVINYRKYRNGRCFLVVVYRGAEEHALLSFDTLDEAKAWANEMEAE